MKINCKGKKDCGCGMKTFRNNFALDVRNEKLAGQDYLVVPVIMARADVVMNEIRYPANELEPHAWDGVPVTAGHPMEDGQPISANSPKTIEDWCIGRIFNSTLEEENILKAEAWLEVSRVKKIIPKLLSFIRGNKRIDVSTGLFCSIDETGGELNGVSYALTARNIRPNHLAILTDEEGACSFESGCGVRSNQRGKEMTKAELLANLAKFLGVNEGETPEFDKAGAVANLIASEASPFSEADAEAMNAMSDDTVKALSKQYASTANAEDEGKVDEDMAANAAKAAAVAAAGRAVVKNKTAVAKSVLSAEDRAVLDAAKAIVNSHRETVLKRVVANSGLKAEDFKDVPTAVLEKIAEAVPSANNVTSFPSFAGRPVPVDNEASSKEEAEAMGVEGVMAHFKKKGA